MPTAFFPILLLWHDGIGTGQKNRWRQTIPLEEYHLLFTLMCFSLLLLPYTK